MISFFVGYTPEEVGDAAQHVPNFSFRSDLKPETLLRQQEEKLSKFLESAKRIPYFARIKQAAIVAPTGTQLYHGGPEGLVRFFNDLRIDNAGIPYPGNVIRLIGFDVKHFVKILVAQAGMDRLVNDSVALPPRFYTDADYVDIMSFLISSEDRENVPLSLIFKRLLNRQPPEGFVPGRNAAQDAMISAYLCSRLRAIPGMPDLDPPREEPPFDLPEQTEVKPPKKKKLLAKAK